MRSRRAWFWVGFVGLGAATLVAVACSDDNSGVTPPPSGTSSGSPGGSSGGTSGAVGDGGSPDAEAGATCTPSASGPLGLACADFPAVAPCPSQDVLKDSTKLAALKAALTSGVVLHTDTPLGAGDTRAFKAKCGLDGFWDPSQATDLVPPATPVPELRALFSPYSTSGHAGICASFQAPSPATDGFPAAGTYRFGFQAAYQGQTYAVRARATVAGSSAGQSFVAAGVSDGGASSNVAFDTAFTYQVGPTAVAEAAVWPSLVAAFSASTTDFPSATMTVQPAAGGAPIWSAKLELLCAAEAAAPAAGPGVVTVQATIPVPAEPGAMAFARGVSKAYVAMTARTDAGLTNGAGVAVIDDAANTLKTTISLGTAIGVAVAANGTTNRVYVSEETGIAVIDATTDTVLTTVASPAGQIQGVAVDEARNLVYALTGGPKIYILDGSNDTFGGSPVTLSGFTVQPALFGGGRPELAYDATGDAIYAIGLDSSLNGVVATVNATSKLVANTTLPTGLQPTSVAAAPGIGAVVTTVSVGGASGALLVGATTPVSIGGTPAAVATCGAGVNVVGYDGRGNALLAAFAPAAGALGAATTLNASELTENGYVPLTFITSASGAGGCTFYSGYTYNPNALYTGGSIVPLGPDYVVKLVNH